MKLKFLLIFCVLVNTSMVVRSASLVTTKPSLYSLKSPAVKDFLLRNKYKIGTGFGLLALSRLSWLIYKEYRKHKEIADLSAQTEERMRLLSESYKEIRADVLRLFCPLIDAFNQEIASLNLDTEETYVISSEQKNNNYVLLKDEVGWGLRFHPLGISLRNSIRTMISIRVDTGPPLSSLYQYYAMGWGIATEYGTCGNSYTATKSDKRLFEGLLYQILEGIFIDYEGHKLLDFLNELKKDLLVYIDRNKRYLFIDNPNLDEYKEIGVIKNDRGDAYVGKNKVGKMIMFIRDNLPTMMNNLGLRIRQ